MIASLGRGCSMLNAVVEDSGVQIAFVLIDKAGERGALISIDDFPVSLIPEVAANAVRENASSVDFSTDTVTTPEHVTALGD